MQISKTIFPMARPIELATLDKPNVGVVHPDVIKSAFGVYWMFYTSYPPENNEQIFLARSDDGIHFNSISGNTPIITSKQFSATDSHIADPSVIVHEGLNKLVYTGVGYADGVLTGRIIMQTNREMKADGWSRPVILLDPPLKSSFLEPALFRYENRIHMIHREYVPAGINRLRIVYDVFSGFESKPIQLHHHTQFDSITHPYVFMRNGIMTMYCIGEHKDVVIYDNDQYKFEKGDSFNLLRFEADDDSLASWTCKEQLVSQYPLDFALYRTCATIIGPLEIIYASTIYMQSRPPKYAITIYPRVLI